MSALETVLDTDRPPEPAERPAVATTPHRFVALDGMRGIAAIAVMGMHAGSLFAAPVDLSNAYMAVDFFFCLSGFVVAHAYDAKLGVRLTTGAFLWRRFVRLYPMLAIGSIIGIGVALAQKPPREGLEFGAASLVLLPILTRESAFPLNPPMWSLFFEWVANVGYAFAPRGLSNRVLAAATVAMGLVFAALILWRGHFSNFGVGGTSLIPGFLRVAYPFAAGVVISRLDLWTRVPVLPWWLPVALLGAALLHPGQSMAANVLFVVVGVPLIVTFGARTPTKYSTAVFSQLGRISYPLYLVHMPIVWLLSRLLPHDATGFWIAIAAGVGAAYVAMVFIDEPVRAALGRLRFRPVAARP